MPADTHLPPGFAAPAARAVERVGVAYTAAVWNAEALAGLAAGLAGPGRRALAGVPTGELAAAWEATIEAFLDPASPERGALDPALARVCRLSPAGLAAALAAVLGGQRGASAREVFAAAGPPRPRAPLLVVLAANLPALAVQPLLPALALRRPVILKSASAEPLFAPAFLAALTRRLPAAGPALAALTWPGGQDDLEAPLLAAVERVVAYGEQASLADLGRRAPGKLVGYGEKTSLAVIGQDADPAATAAGLARDIALFDQRGCLSIAAVYTAGGAARLAHELATALDRLARIWPPGPASVAEAAGVQQLRAEAELRGLLCPPLPAAAGTVVVEPLPALRPTPGRRSVRVHPLADLGRLPALLTPWSGRLQGTALAGAAAWDLAPALAALGVSRVAAPGELQAPDARWFNGGIDPLAALA